MIHIINSKRIEVAFFKSIFPDVPGTDDGKKKGRTPKGTMYRTLFLGRRVKNSATVIPLGWGAIKRDIFVMTCRRHVVPAFLFLFKE